MRINRHILTLVIAGVDISTHDYEAALILQKITKIELYKFMCVLF